MPVAKGETIDVERTRGKLLRAATELFYRDGTTVGVDAIAQHAAVSKLTIYRHFGGKEALLEEVLRQRSDRVADWLRSSVAGHADPVERVLAVFDALGGWYAEARFRGCAIVNAATQSPPHERAPGRVAAAHLGRLRDLLTTLAADAGAHDPDRVGRQLLILLEGATVVASVAGDVDAAADARELARRLLVSHGARSAPGPGRISR